ncbi:aminopeptidase N, partial [Biomphalaria glabrata]
MRALAGFVFFILVATGAFCVCVIIYFTGGNREMVNRYDPEIVSGERSDCLRLASQGYKELCEKCPAPNISLKGLHMKRQAEPCLPLIDNSASSTPSFNIQQTPTVTPKLTNYRIPTSLYPTHYNIEIQTYIAGDNSANFFFKGHVKIWLRCDEPSDNVPLHLNGLTVDYSSLGFYSKDLDHISPNYTDWSADKKRNFFILNLDDFTEAGKTYVIEMSYTSPFSKELNGFYLSSYKGKNKIHYQAVTQFQPTDARKAFPCFDEPAIKSTFNVTLVRPSGFTSISNMPLIDNSTTFVEDGVTYVKDVYAQTKKMSTYLLAFVVSDFSYIQTTTKDGVLCRAWARQEEVSSTAYALNITTQGLAFFEELFGVSFPLPKLDMIALPDFAAAGMENWGLMTFREWIMLYTKGVTSTAYQQIVALYVSHELAHQ